MSTPVSVPTRRASRWSCDRAKVRPQSARAVICRRLVTTNSRNAVLSSFLWGILRLPAVRHASRRLSAVRNGSRRGSPLGRRQTNPDQSVYALPSPLGAPPFVERNRRVLSHFLGQGVRCGRTCRHLGTGAPRARPDRRDRRHQTWRPHSRTQSPETGL
jgi:hypothetical protein